MRTTVLFFSVCLAFLIWFFIFSIWTKDFIPFWPSLSLGCVLLTSIAFTQIGWPKKFHLHFKDLWLGVLVAGFLYVSFFFGTMGLDFFFPSTHQDIQLIYQNKSSLSSLWISGLLLFIIGPGEEIFWRGYVQKECIHLFGLKKGFALSLFFYTGVHFFAFNLPLLLAAFTCGLFWGLMRLYFRSFLPVILSHAFWDFAVFILFPLQ